MVTKCPLYLLHISPKIYMYTITIREKNTAYIWIAHTVAHTDFGKRLVKFKGSRLWNNLPYCIKIRNSIPAFKNSLKNYLLTA